MSASGYYIGQSSDSNGMKVSATTSYSHSIGFSGDNNDADLVSNGAHLRYNAASNQLRFRYYKSSSYTGQKAIQLYKFVSTADPVPVTITEYMYASFSSDKDLDFTPVTGLKAYIVTGANGSTILTEQVYKVKAGTGLVLFSQTADTYNIPVADKGKDYSETNNMIAVTEDNTTIGVPDEGTNYVLAVQDGKAVFAYIAIVEATLGKGKAYLHLDGAPAAPYLSFEGGETTGIGNVNRETITNNQYYTLDGRRVENPSNGVYIVNGKKVVIK